MLEEDRSSDIFKVPCASSPPSSLPKPKLGESMGLLDRITLTLLDYISITKAIYYIVYRASCHMAK